MGFSYPFLLLLLLLIPLYLWLRARWHSRELKQLRIFVRPVLWDRVIINPPPSRTLSRTLWAVSFALLVVSVSGPTWGRTSAVVSTGGKNLVIALDVSQSMASQDEMPSRLARAASEIERLADELRDVRVALVLFSGSSRLAVPLTLDREFLADRLPLDPWSNPDIIPGTRLGDMVDLMGSSLPDMDLEASLGIVFSDGGFHDYAVESAVDAASRYNLRLITVGVGGPIEVTIPSPDGGVLVQAPGDTVRTCLEEEPLQELAERTGGVYIRLSGSDDLVSITRSFLDNISSRNSELATGGSTGSRRFQYFLASAIILMGAAIVLERRGV
ncbi:MAG: VWA domain-containing protein [Candidatus Fermentibacteraceae bacterium]|nr:VWA domain-containing protein [Candidatus Fermentibacteraceae bacterium]